jgi:pilus assembly protein CpaC
MNRRFASALAGLIIVILVAGPQAQQQVPAFGTPAAVTNRDGVLVTNPASVHLLVGRSTILDIGSTIARVSLTVPDVADAMVTAPTQLLIHGKQPGTISMFVWDRMGAIKTYEVIVRRDLSALVEQVKNLFPGEPITVAGSGKDVVLSGTVSSKYVIDKAADVAAGYVEKKENVVNLLKQQEGVASNQVMLKVRFAEVSRNALQEVGASLFSDGNNDMFGRATTQQFAAPIFDQQGPMLGDTLVFSDYLNLFLFDAKNKIGAVVKALQGKGVFQSLAEPNLIALNGKEASFLAGGEFPYPIPQGQLGAVSITFKEYGVRLHFTPTVLGGELINLKIRPEVSSLDFNNAIIVEGFRVPALVTRRAETEVELMDGQTFAIAGLLNNTAVSQMRKVPGLGDIPVLGLLFKSRAYQKDQTELVVMVTPQIVRRGSTGASQGIPSLVEPFMPANDKPIAPPSPYVGSPVYPPQGGGASAPASAPQPVTLPQPPKSSPMTTSQPVTMPKSPASAPAMPQPVKVQAPATENTGPIPVPVPSTSIQASAPLPIPAAEPALTEKQKKELEEEEERRQKAAAAEEERKEEEAKIAAKKAEEERKKAEKAEKERAKRQAEADKKAAEQAEKEARKKLEEQRKKAAEEEKRTKAVAEAAERLKEAQKAYQAEIAKTNKGGIK